MGCGDVMVISRWAFDDKIMQMKYRSKDRLLHFQAGIPIFVTGGIGGVHRGAEKTFDVSADLTELGRTPVAVISAGVKSILDIGKTLEYLVRPLN